MRTLQTLTLALATSSTLFLTSGCDRGEASNAAAGAAPAAESAPAASDAPTGRRAAVDALIDTREAAFQELLDRVWALHPDTDATTVITYNQARGVLDDEARAALLGALSGDEAVFQVKVSLEFGEEDERFPWFTFLTQRNARSSGSGRYTREIVGQSTRVSFSTTTDLDTDESFPTARFALERAVEPAGRAEVEVTLRYEATE